jgi:uncharacterized protein YbaP (TraB family)
MPKPLCAILLSAWFALLSAPALAATAQCDASAEASRPTPEMVQAAMHEAQDHGYLWRIRKDGRTSYLYGTIHVGQLDWMFPGPRVMQALQDTDALALELDPLDPAIQARLAKGIARMPHAPIPEALQRRVRQAAEALCVPYETIAAYAPEFQIVTLSALAGRPEHLEAQYGIDIGLAAVGHKAGKEIISLETPESQLQTLQMRNTGETVAFVEDGLDELEPGRATALLGRMARAWVNADYGELAHYGEWCQCLDTPIERAVMRRLLDERNPGLAETIDRLHQMGKRVFAATGSLHLFGPIGLPTLLEKRGYLVEQVDLHLP